MSDPALRRVLALGDAVAIGYGAIIGAGIFVVTGVAAGLAGPALLVGLAIAAVAATANALSSAQLAASYPYAGGAYEYGYRVLHPWAGFAAGWMFLTSKIAASGTVAIGIAGYVEALVPGLPTRPLAVGAILAFTALHYSGVTRSSRANQAIVLVSIASLLAFVIAGAPTVDVGRMTPFAPAGWRGTLEAAALLFFAYTGYARIATLAEEVRDPARTIPRAILLTIVGAVVLYGLVAVVALGNVGAAALAGTAAPLHLAALAFKASWAAPAVAIGGVVAMLGVVLSQLLALSRMVFAMARRGDLPAALGQIDPRSGVPGRAVVVTGLTAAAVAATGSLRGVASAASFAILVYYGIANIAAWRMSPTLKRYPDAVALVGVISCATLAMALPWRVVGTGLSVLAVGVVARWLLQRDVNS